MLVLMTVTLVGWSSTWKRGRDEDLFLFFSFWCQTFSLFLYFLDLAPQSI